MEARRSHLPWGVGVEEEGALERRKGGDVEGKSEWSRLLTLSRRPGSVGGRRCLPHTGCVSGGREVFSPLDAELRLRGRCLQHVTLKLCDPSISAFFIFSHALSCHLKRNGGIAPVTVR